jgi:hypothetical protein
MRCEGRRRVAVSLARGEATSSSARRHVATCLRCQAAVVREKRFLSDLRQINHSVGPPPGLLERILSGLEAPKEGKTVSRSRRPLGGPAGAIAASVAGAGVLAMGLGTRRGRRVLGLAG